MSVGRRPRKGISQNLKREMVTRREFLKETGSVPITPEVTQWTTAGTLLLDTPNCTTKVATDRVYSIEHVWVKTSADNVARTGISDKLQALISTIQNVSLEKANAVIGPDGYFGLIQALKMNVDLISPISGKVIISNAEVSGLPSLITNKPCDEGWLLQVQLSKPEELSGLLSPADYVKAIANQIELPPCAG